MQVFKYRYICNHVATLDEDNRVMTGYYNHFRSVMCIIISMVGFNVFNIISEVLFLIKFFKWEWGEVWWYWWVAEGLCAAFEGSVILYVVVMLYQIACYFQGHKFRFLMITIITALKFLYTSILTGFVFNCMVVPTETEFPQNYINSILNILTGIFIFEFILRFPMLFSFVRSTERVLSKYINEFLNDMITDDLDRQHSVDKVLAGKLFQIAGWGTISVSFMTSLVYVLQYLMLASFILISDTFLIPSASLTELSPFVVSLFILIKVFTILPSILYCIFLIMLWLYFRDKTKVKYSGYSSDDPEILNRISVLFAGFFAPVLEKKWTWDISLQPGDYHLLEGSMLKNCCYNDQFEILVEKILPNISEDLSCGENIFAGEILHNENHYVTIIYDTSHNIVLLRNNSVIYQQIDSNYNSLVPYILVKSPSPCYYQINTPYQYFSHNFYQKLGKDSCKGAESIQYSDTHLYTPQCNNDTSKTGELNCTVKYNGLYHIDTFSDTQTDITVKKFGYVINESNTIPLNGIEGEHIHKYDFIEFNSTTNTNGFCSIHVTCRFHLAFRILMPFLILLSSMFLLTVGLILIHKI